jgi:nucleotide-binding universal stress UspA family protein
MLSKWEKSHGYLKDLFTLLGRAKLQLQQNTERKLSGDKGNGAQKYCRDVELKFVSAGVSVETQTRVGDPTDVINKHGEQESVDLIIMGTVGLKGISKITPLGSVSRRVSEEASFPVLLVR